MNKIKQLLGLLLFAPVLALAQSTGQNYVKSETVLNSSGSTIKTVQYYNGLGYPSVSVTTTGDGGQTTYSAVTYDALGREERKYAPVSIDSSIGYANPTGSSYGDNTPYGRTQYDALDRPVAVTTPGSAFASSPATIAYAANAANEVIRYGVSGNSLVQDGYYPATTLTKDTHTDADGKKVETFKNLFGNIVMQRVGGSLCTYYVYDNLDRLRFVLPPKYQSDKNLAATGYEYRYDDRGRITYKQLPGAGYTEYWYDAADRMICMQDAEMRSADKYRFLIYDKFDRLVVQGLCTNCLNSSTVWNATFSSGSTGMLGTGYSNTPALTNAELEIANYYDGNQSGNPRFSSLSLSSTSVPQKSQLTGVITKATNGEELAKAMQYDLKGNIISYKAQEIGSRIASNASSYTYTNKLAQSATTVDIKYGGNMTVTESFGYNANNNQKSSHTVSVNHSTAASATTTYTYNDLGQLASVSRPSILSRNRIVSYTYDLRGWLKSITASTFAEELFYADGPGTPYYNGNISSIRWKDNTQSSKRGYKFSYDAANRLTSGAYGEGDALGSNTNRYTESMSYDENGNIKTLERYGKISSGYGLMDKLSISYTGNQPTSVSESASDNNTSGAMEYKKANGSGYKFNANGSLQADKSRGIAYITYDLNNNPQQIYFTNGSVTKYVYSASGQKLRTVHYTAKPNISRTWGVKPAELTAAQILQADSTDYLMDGKLMMKNGRLDKFYFDGGYVQARPPLSSGGVFLFYFYNQDHLGNIHEVVNANGNVQQVTNYYPFGAPYADAATNADFQPYKYNGKELDKMHGLNTYDYGARQHDPILARWDRIDPLCEKYYSISPYTYCHNNPGNRVDPDGKDDYYTSSGQFLFRDQKETDNIIIRNQLLHELKDLTGAEWLISDIPLEDVVLSAKAYSNIFTNVLLQMEGDDKVDNLFNKQISVGVTFCDQDIKDYYNSPVLHEQANAVTGRVNNDIKVSAKVDYGGNGDNRFMFSTVSNIQNLLGVHEYKGHGVLGWGSVKGNHYDVYKLQMKHATWQRTTKKFKQAIIDNSKQYKK